MLIRFRVNLGSVDATALKLDFRDCTEGKSLTVSDDVGVALVNRGIAEALPEIKAPAVEPELKAVPKKAGNEHGK